MARIVREVYDIIIITESYPIDIVILKVYGHVEIHSDLEHIIWIGVGDEDDVNLHNIKHYYGIFGSYKD